MKKLLSILLALAVLALGFALADGDKVTAKGVGKATVPACGDGRDTDPDGSCVQRTAGADIVRALLHVDHRGGKASPENLVRDSR